MTSTVARIFRILLPLGLLIAVAGGGLWYWLQSRSQPVEARYVMHAVETGSLLQTVTANGKLNPVSLVNVGTQVSGTVVRMYADFNDQVAQGQVLLELDPTTFRAQVEQSSGSVQSAEAALKLARSNEDRLRGLFEKEYVSREEMDQAIQQREAAAAQMRIARGQLARDRANLAYSVIRSPVSGVVVSREVDLGQTVAASFQTPTLFQIARDLREMQIESYVAEADIGKVQVGQKATFTVDAHPNLNFDGEVRQIRLNPMVEQNVVTYNVVVAVDNPDLLLLPGMTAYIAIQVDARDNVLLVPNAALRFRPRDPETLRNRPPGAVAWTVRDGRLAPVSIRTGINNGRMTEITGGELREGDRVVVEEGRTDGARPAQSGSMRMRLF